MTNNNTVAKIEEKTITDMVLNKVNEMQGNGSIEIPNNYSPANALKSAYLILQETQDRNKQPVLQVCTPQSISSALLDMVTQGLNPAKNQGYFIAYGNQLTWSRSYLGTIALTKRVPGVVDVKGYALYKGDNFKLGFDLMTGKNVLKEYEPNIDNKNNANLVGAFAVVLGERGILHIEHMSMEQVKAAWGQGATNGNSPAHKKFPDQMAIKTVINRACKTYVNTSDDSNILGELINMQTDNAVTLEIEENANNQELDFPSNVDLETGEMLDGEPIEAEYEVAEEVEQTTIPETQKAPF